MKKEVGGSTPRLLPTTTVTVRDTVTAAALHRAPLTTAPENTDITTIPGTTTTKVKGVIVIGLSEVKGVTGLNEVSVIALSGLSVVIVISRISMRGTEDITSLREDDLAQTADELIY